MAAGYKLRGIFKGGRAIPPKWSQALASTEKAAAEGDPSAEWVLGFLDQEGLGVPKDNTQALDWYRKAASQGFGNAESSLGLMYQEGLGVPRDLAQALNWYQKASAEDDDYGECQLGFAYLIGFVAPRDYGKALAWFQKAATHGDARADLAIGSMYRNGRGVPRDYTQALRWDEKAAAGGNTAANNTIAYMYLNGIGVPQDGAQAEDWYRKAAAQGDTFAKAQLNTLAKQQVETSANWGPWVASKGKSNISKVFFRSACSVPGGGRANWLVEVKFPGNESQDMHLSSKATQHPTIERLPDVSDPVNGHWREMLVAHLSEKDCTQQPQVVAVNYGSGWSDTYVYKNGKVKEKWDNYGQPSVAAAILTGAAAGVAQGLENRAAENASNAQAQAQAAKQQAQAEALAAQQAAAAQRQATQAQAQAAAAQGQAAAAQRNAGSYSRPTAGATPQAQRPPLRVNVVSGSVQAGDPHQTVNTCGQSVDNAREAEWEESFRYSVWSNQPARVSLTITLSNGDTVHRQFTIPLGGAVPDEFTWDVGCGFYPPQKLTISNIHLDDGSPM